MNRNIMIIVRKMIKTTVLACALVGFVADGYSMNQTVVDSIVKAQKGRDIVSKSIDENIFKVQKGELSVDYAIKQVQMSIRAWLGECRRAVNVKASEKIRRFPDVVSVRHLISEKEKRIASLESERKSLSSQIKNQDKSLIAKEEIKLAKYRERISKAKISFERSLSPNVFTQDRIDRFVESNMDKVLRLNLEKVGSGKISIAAGKESILKDFRSHVIDLSKDISWSFSMDLEKQEGFLGNSLSNEYDNCINRLEMIVKTMKQKLQNDASFY